jgi:ribosome recycling factor
VCERHPVPELQRLLSPAREIRDALRPDALHESGEHRSGGVRAVRRDSLELVKKINKDKAASEDDCKRTEKDIQALTDKWIAVIDAAFKAKEADLKKV